MCLSRAVTSWKKSAFAKLVLSRPHFGRWDFRENFMEVHRQASWVVSCWFQACPTSLHSLGHLPREVTVGHWRRISTLTLTLPRAEVPPKTNSRFTAPTQVLNIGKVIAGVRHHSFKPQEVSECTHKGSLGVWLKEYAESWFLVHRESENSKFYVLPLV